MHSNSESHALTGKVPRGTNACLDTPYYALILHFYYIVSRFEFQGWSTEREACGPHQNDLKFPISSSVQVRPHSQVFVAKLTFLMGFHFMTIQRIAYSPRPVSRRDGYTIQEVFSSHSLSGEISNKLQLRILPIVLLCGRPRRHTFLYPRGSSCPALRCTCQARPWQNVGSPGEAFRSPRD